MSDSLLEEMSNAVRCLSIDAIHNANSGHPGMPLGMADVITVLFAKYLNHNPDDVQWFDRDRFILSNGHGVMLLYSILYLTGYISIDNLKNFRQLGSNTPGHPEFGVTQGVDATTGPLGQGLAYAVGMALAESIMKEEFGEQLINHFTYVIVGDGCLMEGISHEAASLAGHLKLNKLIVLFDDNNVSIDGPIQLSCSDNIEQRFESYGWAINKIDGHNFNDISLAIEQAQHSELPSLICCQTIIGKFSSHAGLASAHSRMFTQKEIQQIRKRLNWHKPFYVQKHVQVEWNKTINRIKKKYNSYTNISIYSHEIKKKMLELQRRIDKQLPYNIENIFNTFKQHNKKYITESTRSAFGRIMNDLTQNMPELIGGSADLTDSNHTKYYHMHTINRNNYRGNYIHYGVREHAMASCMNGMALHGGILPYGGTFLVFSDYCRPAIRLSALMKQQVIYVMTHDSIGVGEDGPTHQPIEHLSALRSIINLYVFRPSDTLETLACLYIALNKKDAPSLFALSRQQVHSIYKCNSNIEKHDAYELVKFGAYILYESLGTLEVTIFATGSEVEIAIDARSKLHIKGIGTRVVSMPCCRIFDEQDDQYRELILNNHSIKVAIEAGSEMGWHKYIDINGIFIGMSQFGASAPYKELYEHFNINADYVVQRVSEKLI
ncbi:transketolase [Wolbachia endosymbiont of Howardula sp.]|uniref:transketolase n=1 Tax=Wolbachia endosymbiont of Howardula sp. TaxID=2916816 RepID=UPI00217ED06E|nr:transketolase [Wolbachia endosymbiont of Howardula sp.]UWI83065.1 transketolase [Wolbachia endosymbiont of Howardula sp.]